MIRYSENDRANYPREPFWCEEKENRVKILPRVTANRRSNSCALESNAVSIWYIDKDIDVSIRKSYYAFNLLNPILKKSRRFETAPPPPPQSEWEASENRTKQRCRTLRQTRKPWQESFKKGQCNNSSRSSKEIRIWVKDFFVASEIARCAAFNLVLKGQMINWLLS